MGRRYLGYRRSNRPWRNLIGTLSILSGGKAIGNTLRRLKLRHNGSSSLYPVHRRTGHYRMYCSHYLADGTQSNYHISYPSKRGWDTPGSTIVGRLPTSKAWTKDTRLYVSAHDKSNEPLEPLQLQLSYISPATNGSLR
jgi:hypothetical protein